MTQDVLATLTRAQREAVRVLIARAWMNGDASVYEPTAVVALYRPAVAYALAALPEPAPRTVTRPRVEVFGGDQWRIVNGTPQWLSGSAWTPSSSGPCLKTRADAALWLALWDTPTETVEVPDDDA